MKSAIQPQSGLDLLPSGPARSARAGSGLRTLLLVPGRAALGHRNRLSNFTFFLLAAAGGSAASVVAIILSAWALISVLLRRFTWRFERSDRPVLVSTGLFFAAMAGSNLVHGLSENGMTGMEAVKSVVRLLPFLFAFLLIPRMRCSAFADTLPPAFRAAAVGGVLLAPISVVSFFVEGGRAEGFAGNAGPFSVTALLTAGWALLSLDRRHGRAWFLLGIAGAAGASVAVVMSGMRGAWPGLPVVLAIGMVARRHELIGFWREEFGPVRRLLFAAGAALLLLVAGYCLSSTVSQRIGAAISDLSLISAEVDTATSLNLRRSMYKAAAAAISERPVFGYGAEAHWTAITPYLDSQAFTGFSFSHLHNIFLTVAVDAGLVGALALVLMVASPIVVAWRARRRLGGTRRLAAGTILVAAFLIPGLSNVMFFHDILDAVWIFALSLVAASVPAEELR